MRESVWSTPTLGSARQSRQAKRLSLPASLSAALSQLGLAALVFLFIYNISFIIAPSLSTGRLVLLPLAILAWPRLADELKYFVCENLAVLLIFLFVLLYSLLLFFLSRMLDSIQLSRAFHFLLFSILGCVLFSALLKHDVYRFASAFALATLIQALFIGYSWISPAYRVWLSQLLVQGGNIPLTTAIQVPGFSNSSGALLSILQALGVFAALYTAKLSKAWRAIIFYSVAAAIIAASTILVARTGLMLCLIFFAAFLFVNHHRQRIAILLLTMAGLIGLLFVSGSFYAVLSDVNPQVERLGAWAFEFFQRGLEAESFQDLSSQPIPPLTLDTMLGTGIVAALEGVGNQSGNDSGYIQTYYALGLIVALIFYVAVLGLMLKYVALSQDRFLFVVLLVFLFVVEIKEPFIYKYIYPFFLLSLAYMSSLSGRSTSSHTALQPRSASTSL